MRPPYPPEDCPKYDRCSAPRCPLDPDEQKRTRRLHGEPKCTTRKARRVEIGARYPKILPNGGLTSREAASKRRWDRLTPEEQNAQAAALRAMSVDALKLAREALFSSVDRGNRT